MQTGSGTHLTSYLTGTRGYFPGVKQPVREAKHSSQSSPEVKNAWSYTYTHQYTFMVWFSVKKKAQEQLHLYLYRAKVHQITDGDAD